MDTVADGSDKAGVQSGLDDGSNEFNDSGEANRLAPASSSSVDLGKASALGVSSQSIGWLFPVLLIGSLVGVIVIQIGRRKNRSNSSAG